jgi:LmbE family N-acetylglucosaminyl deacetylase
LRPGISFGSITDASATPVREEEVSRLAELIVKTVPDGFVLAPLALGDHIDHRTVHLASIRAVNLWKLGFYEDLPYASWVPESEIVNRAERLSASQGITLTGAAISSVGSVAWKRELCASYKSQIDAQMASDIASFSRQYGVRERIWITDDSAMWPHLKLQRATTSQSTSANGQS